MICDKCGKSNASGVSVCSYCGMEMPKNTECNGFSDILTVKVAEPAVAIINDGRERSSEADMKSLLNKTNEIFKNTKVNLVAICVCVLVSIVSIAMNFNTQSKLNDYEKKLDTIIENTKESDEVVEPVKEPDETKVEEKDDEVADLFSNNTYTSKTKNRFNQMKQVVKDKISANKPEQTKSNNNNNTDNNDKSAKSTQKSQDASSSGAGNNPTVAPVDISGIDVSEEPDG